MSKMNEQICYYENEIAVKTANSVAQSVIFQKSKNIPRIRLWNRFTGEIPSLKNYSEGLKKYYLSKVVDEYVLEDLEEEKVINADCQFAKFYPLKTPADGNCLCHAVSLYLWGIPDRQNFLRQMLYISMVSDENKLLKNLYTQHVANLQTSGEDFDIDILDKQWEKLVKEAQEIPMNPASTHLEALEAIHIFILANILLRPIIVLGSPVVRTVFNHTIQANNIAGVYLPLLCSSGDTVKNPIVLGFHMNHFVPLLHMENSPGKKAVPLKWTELTNLPMYFMQDSLPFSVARKLNSYLEIDKDTESAFVGEMHLPIVQNMFHAHFEYCKSLYDNTVPTVGENSTLPKDIGYTNLARKFLEQHSETIHIIASSTDESPSFCINNCGMYGSAEMGNKCSKCFAKDTSLSDTTRSKSAMYKQKPKVTYGDVLEQKTYERSHQFNIKPQTPEKTNPFSPQVYSPLLYSSSLNKPHEKSLFNSKQTTPGFSYFDLQAAGFLNGRQPWIEKATRPTPQQVDDEQFEGLETATCITLGCHSKAYRKAQYRCESCIAQMNSEVKGKAFLEPVHTSRHPEVEEKLREISDNFSEKLLSQTGAFSSTGSNLVHRSENQLNPNMGNRQVSLLELLCLKDNCPNRRASLLDPFCESCSRKNSMFYCSVTGCSNKKEQNSYGMCTNCFQNNVLKRDKPVAIRNTNEQTAPLHIYETKTEQRKCYKPNCINSGVAYAQGYCIQCFAAMEKKEPPQPSAPMFPN